METFDSLLSQRFPSAVTKRFSLSDASESLPKPISRLIRRQLFRWPYRHMKDTCKAIRFEQHDQYGWEICGERFLRIQLHGLPTLTSEMKSKALIVASGPSALDYDYHSIDQSQTSVIAVSGSVSFLTERGITPDYWVISDNNFPKRAGKRHFENSPGVPLITTHNAIRHIAQLYPEHLQNRPVAIIERVNQWYGLASLENDALLAYNQRSGNPFRFPKRMDGKSAVGWSDRPELGFCSGNTVVFAALQISVANNVRKIEITGMDLSDQTRCYNEGNTPIANNLTQDYKSRILPAFQLMNNALHGRGIEINNLSKTCPLPPEIFEFEQTI